MPDAQDAFPTTSGGVTDPPPVNGAPRPRTPRTICPYCGELAPPGTPCPACRGRFDPLSRQASQNAMGPWFVRDPSSPHTPGASFETIARLVRRGRISPETVVRGPSTFQFWTLAKWAPGIAELLGVCHCCGADVAPETYLCASCGTPLVVDRDRQHLGLQPVRPIAPGAPPAHTPTESPGPPPWPAAHAAERTPTAATPSSQAHPREHQPPTRHVRGRRVGPNIALLAALFAAVAGWAVAGLLLLDRQQPAARAAETGAPRPGGPSGLGDPSGPGDPGGPGALDETGSDAPNSSTGPATEPSSAPSSGRPSGQHPAPAPPPAASPTPGPQEGTDPRTPGTIEPPEGPAPTTEERVMALLEADTLEDAETALELLESLENQNALESNSRKLLEFVRRRVRRLRLRDIP